MLLIISVAHFLLTNSILAFGYTTDYLNINHSKNSWIFLIWDKYKLET